MICSANSGADLHERLRVLHGEYQPARLDTARLSGIRQMAKRLMSKGDAPAGSQCQHSRSSVGAGYPDRIAQRRADQSARYQLSNGKEARPYAPMTVWCAMRG